MSALRERLLVALPTSETGYDGGCFSPFSRCEVDWGSRADRLIAALGPDAARLEAALAPGAVTVTVEDVARRLHADIEDCYGCRVGHGSHPADALPWAEARRILGIDGGQ